MCIHRPTLVRLSGVLTSVIIIVAPEEKAETPNPVINRHNIRVETASTPGIITVLIPPIPTAHRAKPVIITGFRPYIST